jgi:hypothetical protein
MSYRFCNDKLEFFAPLPGPSMVGTRSSPQSFFDCDDELMMSLKGGSHMDEW